MSSDQLLRIYSRILPLQILGVLGHYFFFQVQENIYTGPNSLKWVSDMLMNQVSATSYFVCLSGMGSSILLFFFFAQLIGFRHRKIAVVVIYFFPTLVGLVYSYYEYYQYYHPTYVDNNLLDVVMAWLAWLTIIIVLKLSLKEAH